MKLIETESKYEYKQLFTAVIDTEDLSCEIVGKDSFGQLILNKSFKIGDSMDCGSMDEYYVLTDDEYKSYVKLARKNKLIRFCEKRKLLKEKGTVLNGAEPPAPQNTIVSFDVITLRESGMRGATEYEIVSKDGAAVVSHYYYKYCGGDGPERELDDSASVPVDQMLKLLNDCKILSWNNFDGPHPKGVLDGIMFNFNATVNGGHEICARGSQNFPKKYYDFTGALYLILHDKK